MSIAQKLKTVAENMPKVFEAGYAKGQAEGGGVVIDPDKIIEKTVSGTTIHIDDVSEIPHKCAVSVDKDANVTVCGKNLVNLDAMLNSRMTKDENGIYHLSNSNGTSAVWHFDIPIPANTPVTFTFLNLKGQNPGQTALINLSKAFADGSQGPGVWFGVSESFSNKATIIHNSDFLRFAITAYKPSEDYYCEFSGLQVEIGKTSTAYEPYNAETHPITAGQTIEVDSICPTMTLSADNDATITFGYQQSWGIVYGKQAEYDRFWDVYQQNGKRADCQYAFYNWDNACYNPKYPINGVIANSFRGSTITNTQVPIVATASSASAFYGCASLVNIQSLDLSESTNLSYVFQNCTALQEIRITGNINLAVSFAHSSKLSTDSIQSIIDHLADLTGKTAQTLTLHATVSGKLTDAQKASITAKNWTLVY